MWKYMVVTTSYTFIQHKCSWSWQTWLRAASIVWLHSNLETKPTQSCTLWVGWSHCSLYSVVLTVPDKAPFSNSTDTAHPQLLSLTSAFTCMFPKYISAHWRDESLLAWSQSPSDRLTEGKRWQWMYLLRLKVSVTYFVILQMGYCQTLFYLQSNACLQHEDCNAAACSGNVCVERHIYPENLRF